MLVSFIIPSYNSAQTVKRCLDSIYALSLKPTEFEVIFVDDCSTDNTCDIVTTYQAEHTNFTLLRQPKNNRQGAARNRGVSVAKGEYICFVDSDDVVTEGIVSAIRIAKELRTDMTAFHYAFVNENVQKTKEAVRLSFEKGQLFSGIEMQNTHPYWCSGPVAYVYNRAFIERVNYPFVEGMLYEDSDFVAVHLYYAERMTYSPELGYIAYHRAGSTTHSMTYKNVADYLLLGTRMLRFYELMNEGVKELRSEREKQFAEGILEGACYNIERAFHYMPRLASADERKACYARIEAYTHTRELAANPLLRKYYWRTWTHIGLSAPWLMNGLSTLIAPIYNIKNRLSQNGN